jgi:N-acetyl-alpha-D-glucosaminyl L-malate synthase BshA
VQFSINQSNVVTSVSADLKKKTNELFQLDKEISVVPNFIDASKYVFPPADCQRTLIAKDTERVVTHISNFRKVKRIPDVIEIFDRIQQQIPAKLMMVGDGPEREHAERLCEEKGIQDRVVFLGNSNEIDRILCFSDLFLLPSVSESFGLAALEAMINRTPVVSSDTGGIPEVNIHGVTGFLSPVRDVESMAKHSIYLLSDDERLEKFKAQAYAQALNFDIQKIVPQYEAVYACAMASV